MDCYICGQAGGFHNGRCYDYKACILIAVEPATTPHTYEEVSVAFTGTSREFIEHLQHRGK